MTPSLFVKIACIVAVLGNLISGRTLDGDTASKSFLERCSSNGRTSRKNSSKDEMRVYDTSTPEISIGAKNFLNSANPVDVLNLHYEEREEEREENSRKAESALFPSSDLGKDTSPLGRLLEGASEILLGSDFTTGFRSLKNSTDEEGGWKILGAVLILPLDVYLSAYCPIIHPIAVPVARVALSYIGNCLWTAMQNKSSLSLPEIFTPIQTFASLVYRVGSTLWKLVEWLGNRLASFSKNIFLRSSELLQCSSNVSKETQQMNRTVDWNSTEMDYHEEISGDDECAERALRFEGSLRGWVLEFLKNLRNFCSNYENPFGKFVSSWRQRVEESSAKISKLSKILAKMYEEVPNIVGSKISLVGDKLSDHGVSRRLEKYAIDLKLLLVKISHKLATIVENIREASRIFSSKIVERVEKFFDDDGNQKLIREIAKLCFRGWMNILKLRSSFDAVIGNVASDLRTLRASLLRVLCSFWLDSSEILEAKTLGDDLLAALGKIQVKLVNELVSLRENVIGPEIAPSTTIVDDTPLIDDRESFLVHFSRNLSLPKFDEANEEAKEVDPADDPLRSNESESSSSECPALSRDSSQGIANEEKIIEPSRLQLSRNFLNEALSKSSLRPISNAPIKIPSPKTTIDAVRDHFRTTRRTGS